MEQEITSRSQWMTRNVWCYQSRYVCWESHTSSQILRLQKLLSAVPSEKYVELPLGNLREHRSLNRDWHDDIGSSPTELREITTESPTPHFLHILVDTTLIPSATNTKETMSVTEIHVEHIISKLRWVEYVNAWYAATIAHAKWNRHNHHRDVLLGIAIGFLTKSSSPWPLGYYLWTSKHITSNLPARYSLHILC